MIVGKDVKLEAIDREGEPVHLPLAIGDRIRFSETLHKHKIRNGTRGVVEKYAAGINGSVRVSIRLEDGRQIEDEWSGFAQQRRRRHAGVPKIVHGIAGSAYSVQGRTAVATVHHIAGATDAREIYVGLTRHRHDVQIVVESDRLDAACRARQVDPRMSPTKSALLECLFEEAGRYHEKANVVDHVVDRTKFMEIGSIGLPRSRSKLNIDAVVEAARRVELAAQRFGSRGRAFTVQLRQLARRILPDHSIPETVKTIMEKVQSWTRGQPSRRLRDSQQSRSYEYGR